MADLFVIYSHHDKSFVEKLVEELTLHWTVWWDDQLVGKFQNEIPEHLKNCKCVIPIWSTSSSHSEIVFSELEIAKKAGLPLIPVKLEICEAPYGYAEWSEVDMTNWRGDKDQSALGQLKRKIKSIVKPTIPTERPIHIEGFEIHLPVLFHSTSSYETRISPQDAIKIISAFNDGEPNTTAPVTILVSAYDLVEKHCKTIKEKKKLKNYKRRLNRFRQNGGVVMIDSGNYEAEREGDKTWSSPDMETALDGIEYDWLLLFDYTEPTKDLKNRKPLVNLKQIVNQLEKNTSYSTKPIIPIVHSPEHKVYGHDLTSLPSLIRQISEHCRPEMIAIPERELGPTLFDCAITIRRVRAELNNLEYYQPIHILGTGNPRSILIYTAAGADSFDGLEWCRYVIDDDSKHLHHTQHYSFYQYQTSLARSKVTQDAVTDQDVHVATKIALHNLESYARFCADLRSRTYNGTLEVMAARFFDESSMIDIQKQIPGLFE